MLAVAVLALSVVSSPSPNPMTAPPRHISAPLVSPVQLSKQAQAGKELFGLRCASCHGIDLQGSQYAPSLRGVGAANVDWWVSTGRMPASTGLRIEKHQQTPMFTRAEIDSLIAYVTSVAPGGPPIPPVYPSTDTALGRQVFVTNCQSCHGAFGQGATVGYGYLAPSLLQKSITDTEIVEAVRIGPAPMPHFDQAQIDQRKPDALVHYLSIVRTQAVSKINYGGAPMDYGGPTSEGFAAWALGMLTLYGVIRVIGTND